MESTSVSSRNQKLLIRGARQLVTLRGEGPRRGRGLSDLGVIVDGAVLIDGDRIDEVGSTRRVENLAKSRGARVIDVSGKVVVPGFVDSHTQLLSHGPPADWSLSRRSPVAQRPTASLKALRMRGRRWAYMMATYGTTTAEIRVGGQVESTAAQLRSLRAAAALDLDPVGVRAALAVSTRHGETDRPAQFQAILEGLTLAARKGLAYACAVNAAGFTEAQCVRIAEHAHGLGIALKLDRADEDLIRLASLYPILALEGWRSDDPADLESFVAAGSIATLLVSAAADDHQPLPPARALIDQGAGVCLATGFGTGGSALLSMPLVMGLACRILSMTPDEALTAATLNGAAAMGLASVTGSIEPGKRADLAVFDVGDYREIAFYLGINLCSMTIRGGRVIYRAGTPPPPPPPAGRRSAS